MKVNGVRVKNVETGESKDISLQGVFLAIGHIPNTESFKGKLDMDENQFVFFNFTLILEGIS